MRNATIQRFLLTALLVTYFLIPTTLPWIGWTPHGVLLLCAMLWYFLTDVRGFRVAASWPFVLFLFAISASWLSARGHAAVGTVRAVGFGVSAAFLVSEYLRGRPGVRGLLILSWAAVVVSALMSSLYVAAVLGAPITFFDPFFIFGQSSYHSGIFFLVAIPSASYLAVCRRRVTFLLLLPLWMGLIVSGLRGLWVGALAAVLAFGIASKRFWHMTAILGIAVLAFTLITVLTERFVERTTGVNSPARQAAASLAAKIIGKTGRDKFREELTTAGRLGYWLTGFHMWADSPLFGVGPGNFASNSERYTVNAGARRDAEKTFDAHNMFVSVLAELGILGFGGLMALIAIPAVRWYRCWRHNPFSRDALALVGAVFVGLTVAGLTWDVHFQRMWWLSLGLLWAASLSGVGVPDGAELR